MALVGKVRWSFRREVVLNNRKDTKIKHQIYVAASPGFSLSSQHPRLLLCGRALSTPVLARPPAAFVMLVTKDK